MKLKFESGRSMVEMLGVLAIVGVLSVGGIMGYSYGMDKYRANETINDIMLMRVDVITQVEQGRNINLSEWGTKTTVGYNFVEIQNPDDETRYGVQITGVPSRICKMIGDGLSSKMAVYVGSTDFKSDEEDDPCDVSNNNTMEFYFDAESFVDIDDNIDDSEQQPDDDVYSTEIVYTNNTEIVYTNNSDSEVVTCLASAYREDECNETVDWYVDLNDICKVQQVKQCPNRELIGNYSIKMCNYRDAINNRGSCPIATDVMDTTYYEIVSTYR